MLSFSKLTCWHTSNTSYFSFSSSVLFLHFLLPYSYSTLHYQTLLRCLTLSNDTKICSLLFIKLFFPMIPIGLIPITTLNHTTQCHCQMQLRTTYPRPEPLPTIASSLLSPFFLWFPLVLFPSLLSPQMGASYFSINSFKNVLVGNANDSHWSYSLMTLQRYLD